MDMSDQGRTNMSHTLLAGSEEDFDVICDPCLYEHQRTEAKAYCLECNENLCDSCIKVHKKMSALRGHAIQKELRSSKSHSVTAGNPAMAQDNDPLTDKCTKHPVEVIKFYCNTHHVLGCGVCVPMDHKNCTDVSYIRDVSSGIANSEELKCVLAEFRQIAGLLKFSKSRSKKNKEKVNERYTQVLEEINCFKEEIIKYLNELVDELQQNASKLKDGAVTASDDQEAECDELIRETEKMTSDLDTRSSMGLNNGLFVAVNLAKAKLIDLQKKADHISGNISTQRFVFERNERLKCLISSPNRLGKLSLISKPRDATYLYDINILCGNDTGNGLVTSVIVLPDSQLAIADNENTSVKLIDVKTRKISEQVTLSSPPICMAAIKEDKVAVTIKDQRYIQVLSLAPALSKSHTIKVPYLYSGVVYTADHFLFSQQFMKGDMTVHVCDSSGKLLRKLDAGGLFIDPFCIAASVDSNVVYVSDYEKNICVALDNTGVVISKYVNASYAEPCGITVDDDDYVYARDGESNVHQLTSSCKLIRLMFTNDHRIKESFAVAYGAGKLYIGSGGRIKVFSLD